MRLFSFSAEMYCHALLKWKTIEREREKKKKKKEENILLWFIIPDEAKLWF